MKSHKAMKNYILLIAMLFVFLSCENQANNELHNICLQIEENLKEKDIHKIKGLINSSDSLCYYSSFVDAYYNVDLKLDLEKYFEKKGKIKNYEHKCLYLLFSLNSFYKGNRLDHEEIVSLVETRIRETMVSFEKRDEQLKEESELLARMNLSYCQIGDTLQLEFPIMKTLGVKTTFYKLYPHTKSYRNYKDSLSITGVLISKKFPEIGNSKNPVDSTAVVFKVKVSKVSDKNVEIEFMDKITNILDLHVKNYGRSIKRLNKL